MNNKILDHPRLMTVQGLSLSFELPVALIFTPVTNLLVYELYQEKTISLVTSRSYQAYSTVTGVSKVTFLNI